MATGKIELNGIKFEPLTLNFTTFHCSGTIAMQVPNMIYISTDKKFLWCTGTRVTISNFHKTEGNPGIAANTNIIPTNSISCYCGIRFDNTNVRPETVQFILEPNGRIVFKTTESYTNASGEPLHFLINSFVVPIN